jgi:hypothetical protein
VRESVAPASAERTWVLPPLITSLEPVAYRQPAVQKRSAPAPWAALSCTEKLAPPAPL